MSILERLKRWAASAARMLFMLFIGLLLTSSQFQVEGIGDRIRRYTRPFEFDFGAWTVQAVAVKLGQWGLASEWYLSDEARTQLVLDFFSRLVSIRELESEIEAIYIDPTVDQPDSDSRELAETLESLRLTQASLEPMVEAILQEQVAVVLEELDLGLLDTVFPPVLFKFSQLPMAVIVSPRDDIRQEANIQVNPHLTLQEIVDLEKDVESQGEYSALVVPVGGLGVYPTMVMESPTLSWVVEVIVHEWVHNYLTLRPLGWNYLSSPELRTMNETTASLLGREIGRQVMLRYYPEFAPPEQVVVPVPPTPAAPAPAEPLVFDFRAEMHQTRLRVDDLLASGEIEEAEQYMEERRLFFWENGYQIRRLNQAYFAFYGAYADVPGGAAGADPVGEAVRRLWLAADSPTQFLELISPMTSFQSLLDLIESLPSID